MPTPNCIVCGKPLERPYIRARFIGAFGSRLDGIEFEVHAGCISMQFPQDTGLPTRVADPVAEPTRDEWERIA